MQPHIGLKVPAEDGITLATDAYLPDGPGPFPAILVRTPYNRVGLVGSARQFTQRGYALVAQDCRGKYESEGVFTPLVDEARDGQAAVDWVANQKWCNGRIGLWGRSYLGIVQAPAASGGHPALRAIAPSVAPGSFVRDWIRYDGCFAHGNAVRWALTHASFRCQPPQAHFSWQELWSLPDLASIAHRVGFETPVLGDWARHDAYDEYWRAVDQDLMHPQIRVPGMHAGGWFDHLTRGQFAAFAHIRDRGATSAARHGQRLLIGPWGHTNTGNEGPEHQRYGEWDFGAEADFSVLAHELRFLDWLLKEEDTGIADEPPVKLFLMGANRWVDFADWPPPESNTQTWFLHSDGRQGTLGPAPPDRDSELRYDYDPTDPAPVCGGPIYWGFSPLGPADQRPVLQRSDILLYRSDPLPRPLTIIGEIGAHLHLCTEVEDTDLIVKLCVETDDGAVTCLSTGSLRCRYREGWSTPTPLPRSEPVSLRIELAPLAYVFPSGSRIVLTITSSEFPRINPHPNLIAAPWENVTPVAATHHILHGPAAPSRLALPVVEC